MSTATKLSIFDEVKQAASGRWPELLENVGGVPRELLDGRKHPCPRCGGRDRFRLIDEKAGALYCNQCFNERNGDGIAAVAWLCDISQKEAANRIARHLGVHVNGNGVARPSDVIDRVCQAKRIPRAGLEQFAIQPAKRGNLDVVRVRVVNEKREAHSYFDLTPDGKGLFKKGKGNSGLFLPKRFPKPGETWLLTEGCKDGAALTSLGYSACGLPTKVMHEKYAHYFKDVDIVLVPDLDEPGWNGAQQSAARLAGIAKSVRTARLPGEMKAKDGDDVRVVLSKPDGERLVREAIERAQPWEPREKRPGNVDNVQTEDDDPHALATWLLESLSDPIRSYRFGWWLYRDIRWSALSDHELRAEIHSRIDMRLTELAQQEFERQAEDAAAKGETPKPVTKRRTTTRLVNDVLDAMRSYCTIPDSQDTPLWLCSDPPFPAEGVIVTQNAIVSIPSIIQQKDIFAIPQTRDLFSPTTLAVNYDPDATCPRWMQFLEEVFPGDQESQDLLRLWFGYVLSNNTNLQQMLYLIGDTRSGKGTIIRVLNRLLGEENVAAKTLTEFASSFGLEGLVNKRLLLFPDVRLSSRTDGGTAMERLLSIVGEDRLDVARKYKPPLCNVSLRLKVMLTSNSPPALYETSGAFLARLRFLSFGESFAGREDRHLTDRLNTELPGILNWAISGAVDVASMSTLPQPSSASDLAEEVESLTTPLRDFVDECLTIDPDGRIYNDELQRAHDEWAQRNRMPAKSVNVLARDLHALVGRSTMRGPKRNHIQGKFYEGIRLKNPGSF